MAVLKEKDIKKQALVEIAKKMVLSARTAPKGRGVDNIEMAVLTDNDLVNLSKKMEEIGELENNNTFLRDAGNVRESADVVVLLGTRFSSLGLKLCGLCGFKNCEQKDKHPDVPCAFNTGDLGIAIGSAISIAMDNRIDNRIMYTIGYAARDLEFLSKDIRLIYGIPMSASSKNPFFDRK